MRGTISCGIALAVLLVVGPGLLALGGARPAAAQSAPTLQITGPSQAASVSNPVQMHITSGGATIKAATEADPNAAHYHYFIDRDPATILQQGQPIPAGQPDIIHTDDANFVLPNLAPGQHTVWVVLAHTDHTPYNPSVQAQVAFTVSSTAATTASGQAPATVASGGLPATGSAGLLSARAAQRPSAILSILATFLLALSGIGLYWPRRGGRQER